MILKGLKLGMVVNYPNSVLGSKPKPGPLKEQVLLTLEPASSQAF